MPRRRKWRFGLTQVKKRTPKIAKRIGRVCAAVGGSATGIAVLNNNERMGYAFGIMTILGAGIPALFGEHDHEQNQDE